MNETNQRKKMQLSTAMGERFYAKNDEDFQTKLDFFEKYYPTYAMVFGDESTEPSKLLFRNVKNKSGAWEGYLKF